MTSKNLLFFVLVAALATLGGCKKSCEFPQRQFEDGKTCWDVRDDYIGNYYGDNVTRLVDTATGLLQTQHLTVSVERATDDKTKINAFGLVGQFDVNGNVVFPEQTVLRGPYLQPYVGSGTGYFGDTILYEKGNKYLALHLLFVPVNDTSIAQLYSSNFWGLR